MPAYVISIRNNQLTTEQEVKLIQKKRLSINKGIHSTYQ